MSTREPLNGMADLVAAVEASRIPTYTEILDSVRAQLSDKPEQLDRLNTLLDAISSCCEHYSTATAQRAETEQNTQLTPDEKTDALARIKSRLGYNDNFFRRELRNLREFLESNRIKDAGVTATLIVNGYRESVGAPAFERNLRTIY